MEVSAPTESANCHIKKPIADSNSNRSPITSRAGNLALAEKDSDKCNHFTIRAYVSEVRKRNAKICLPFPILVQSSADHVNVLPPLHVKRFRRWNCQRCARETIPPETVISNGANMTSQSSRSKNHDTLPVGDAATTSNCEAAKSLARSQQIESSTIIKEGTRQFKVCQHISEDDQNWRSKPNAEACQERKKERSISRSALLSEDNPKILSSKRDRMALVKEQVQGLSNAGKRKELDSHIEVPKNGALPSSLDHMSHHYLKNLEGCNDEESDTSIHFTDARKPGVPVEKSHPKRSRKIRTLDDIMKSVALRKNDKNCIPSENTFASGRGSIQILDASKDNDEHAKHRGHLFQEKEPTSIKRKNKETIPNDGEGTSLIHWLKTVPKKARLHMGELEAKDVNAAASTSKCASLKGVDLNLEYSARGKKKKGMIGEKKRNLMPEVEAVKSSFTPQKESLAQKGRTITEDLQAKNSHSRSPGIVISEKHLHHKIRREEKNHKKAILGNKKNKRLLVENGTSSQIQCFKDSLGVQKQAFVQTQREVKKKERTVPTSEQEAADDIPMDIVEHLAKKQHEKYLMNTEDGCANTSKLSEVIENMKDRSDLIIAGYDAQTSTIDNEDAECRSKYKQCHHFDLNEEAPACALVELQSPSPYIGLSMSGAQLSIIDSNRNCFPQILNSDGMKILPFRSDYMNQTISPQNLFSHANGGGSWELLNGYPSHMNVQNICSNFVYPSSESRCEFCSNITGPVDLHNNETISSSNLLRVMNQTAHPGEPRPSSSHNDNMGYFQSFNSHGSGFFRSEVEDNQGRNMCKPLRPLPRIGILGPMLQKEITNTSNSTRPTLGFGANSQLSFHSFIARNSNESTSHKAIEKVMNAQTSIPRNETLRRINSNGQVATGSRNGAFQPLKSAYKMEECVVNRNPADFAMVDEDGEYLIAYEEAKADRMPHSGKPPSQTHSRSQKGQKMRKLSEIKRSKTSNKASSRGKV